MIVGARLKGAFDLATATGWEAERFARTKTMKALGEYLKTPERKREDGARKVSALFQRMATKQKKGGG